MTSENLLNLEKVGQLDAVAFSQDLLDRMIATARSRLQDALRTDNSAVPLLTAPTADLWINNTGAASAAARILCHVKLQLTERPNTNLHSVLPRQ